ncbi:DUF1800 domain-containing protein [Sabulicella glaciei]|uniref:DUF1800 domain-containing protein n=1 Tax=Sabulicella glaciei TaxID=2984948 RepID=A0ABT3NXM2_9PROT|nr:DUF1800 domain-containing protein [Roseococcus sp. MDT2-1-1]MCW8086907.1 DUF1800 domain-containing protein [Roseococcus sp. MDT2-1-1]
MSARALHAVTRFGLGPRPDQPLPADPERWLRAQIRTPAPLPGPDAADCGRVSRLRRDDPGFMPSGYFPQEARAWLGRLLLSPDGFLERWTDLWCNHLCVSRRAAGVSSWGGHYHRTAIRPHVFGRFEDMFLAAMRHPAMLNYLDNVASYGPGSRAGQNGRLTANENLARETLELHSVTLEGGYAQEDVASLALILTGWNIGRGPDYREPEGFLFRGIRHEPGPKRLMGETFPEGEEGGVAALRFLARHPCTYRNLARRIATHFIADDPPAAALARLEASLSASGGDLGEAARTLVALPEAWQPLRKLASQQDYAVAVLRGIGAGEEGVEPLLNRLGAFDQPLWMPPAPIGWPDKAPGWNAPEQLMRRLDWVSALSSGLAANFPLDPPELVERLRGPLAPEEVRLAVARAPSRREGFILALAHPGMHRR